MLGSGHRLREEDARHGSLERQSSDGRLTVARLPSAQTFPQPDPGQPVSCHLPVGRLSTVGRLSVGRLSSPRTCKRLFSCNRMPAVQEEYEPPLRKSLFDNVPPFLNYLPNGMQGRYGEYFMSKYHNGVHGITARQPHVSNTRTTWWSSGTASGESPWPSTPWSLL